jgi:hypothetical protein
MKRFLLGLLASGLLTLGLAGSPAEVSAAPPQSAIYQAAAQTVQPVKAQYWRRGWYGPRYGWRGGYGYYAPYGSYYRGYYAAPYYGGYHTAPYYYGGYYAAPYYGGYSYYGPTMSYWVY